MPGHQLSLPEESSKLCCVSHQGDSDSEAAVTRRDDSGSRVRPGRGATARRGLRQAPAGACVKALYWHEPVHYSQICHDASELESNPSLSDLGVHTWLF